MIDQDNTIGDGNRLKARTALKRLIIDLGNAIRDDYVFELTAIKKSSLTDACNVFSECHALQFVTAGEGHIANAGNTVFYDDALYVVFVCSTPVGRIGIVISHRARTADGANAGGNIKSPTYIFTALSACIKSRRLLRKEGKRSVSKCFSRLRTIKLSERNGSEQKNDGSQYR